MAAVGKAHAKDGVAWFEDGSVHGLGWLGSPEWGWTLAYSRTEEFFDAVDCQLFDDVNGVPQPP